MIVIDFLDNKPSLRVEADTICDAVKMALAKGEDLRYANLRNADLRWASLKGVDLSYADLFGADLRGANLRGAKLCHANLRRANLSGADLPEADLYDATLSDSELVGTNFREANLRYANLFFANLRAAHLFDTSLYGANLDYSCFPLWCGSLTVKIDKRLFCQLLYHTLRAGQSVDDKEVKALFAIPEVVALANQFHRVKECGVIKMESDGVNQNDEKSKVEVRR